MYTSPYRFFSIMKILEETCKSPENNPPQKNQKNLRKPERNPQKTPRSQLGIRPSPTETGLYGLSFIGLFCSLDGEITRFLCLRSVDAPGYAEDENEELQGFSNARGIAYWKTGWLIISSCQDTSVQCAMCNVQCAMCNVQCAMVVVVVLCCLLWGCCWGVLGVASADQYV